MKLKFVVVACCFGLLAGCSSTPSESEIADQIQTRMNQEIGSDFIEINDLEKTNGREEGENKYIADVEYDMEFTKGADEVSSSMAGGPNGFVAMGMLMTLGKFKEGDVRHVKASYTFAKSEKGWVIVK